jgi:hypothetical protein
MRGEREIRERGERESKYTNTCAREYVLIYMCDICPNIAYKCVKYAQIH